MKTLKSEIISKNPIVRKRHDRLRVTMPIIDTPDDAATQQQFKDECDLNRIVANAQRGIAPKYNSKTPQYGDFSKVPDLMEATNLVEAANEAFMTLPAQLRAELGNKAINIQKLTQEQLVRYKLLKEVIPSQPSPAAKAGQAAPTGTEPVATPKTPKGGSKKSDDSDE